MIGAAHTYCDRGPAIAASAYRPRLRLVSAPGDHERRSLAGKLAGKAELIRLVYSTGLASQSMLARHFGVSVVAIWKVVHGKSYGGGK